MFLAPLFASHFLTGSLHNVFIKEDQALSDSLEAIGIQGASDTTLQCITDRTTYVSTRAICENFALSQYESDPISRIVAASYNKNAYSLSNLLDRRGWTIEKSEAPTLVAVPNYSFQGDESLVLAFHKNVGAITCTLEIDFGGVISPDMKAAEININQFSCQEDITYPNFNLKPRQYNNI